MPLTDAGPPRTRATLRAAGRLARATWSSRSWLATVHVLSGMPVGLLTAATIGGLLAAGAALACTIVVPVACLACLSPTVRGLTRLQRSRFRALLEVEIPPVPRPEAPTWPRRFAAGARSPDTWRQIAYHLLAAVLGPVGGAAVTVAWSVGLALGGVAWYRRSLPDPSPAELVGLTLLGLVLLAAAPWAARGIARADVAAATALLGPNRVALLTHRVEALASSRDGAVEAADAERRRIERDLHDGTQQRLVSLAMSLGKTRARMGDVPDPTRQAIEEAHEEAKLALSELRDLVRGLHPAVLNDRGLDAALSGIVARSPVPVRLSVDLARRCSARIEAVAYFVVAESLTNVAKHARAAQAEVALWTEGDRLRVTVTDDGRGGAVAGGGSGLRGLAQRAAAVDGTMRIESPPGGPTVIEVELPCES